MVPHENSDLSHYHRLPIGRVFAHVQLDNDGFETFPPLVVREVEEFVIGRTRKQIVGGHDGRRVGGAEDMDERSLL